GLVNPAMTIVPGSIFTILPDLYLNGGCPVLNDFDVIETDWDGQYSLAYPSYEGTDYYAAIQTERPNGAGYTSRTMWFGSSFMYIRDGNRSDPPSVRGEIMRTVLLWFLGSLPPPVGDDVPPAYTYRLEQNFPNPFNPATTLRFRLKHKGHATIKVYDVAGRLVAILADEVMEAGPHEVQWDGRNHLGLSVASGIYFCRMEAGSFKDVRKLVLLR
nr:T9SS type A sorting domain-containing protein [Candidatus Krumholzibacteria bacterium]